ncbi:HAMP domain-containing sensor histidine kinase [Hymenobacter sp. M29]|uniref:histidine kinase n=1 Tax=Hymenobacter mellowenesis TaxID=3063995 RepID=A0ABT9AHD4_9BACT|nr:HAMP domain-containing sensor histidine kinase [Hymenobacter sp. M29]MDO7849283.1 HAMP domain-containing sensor histidine kinase [Hymenobacter sp. M29]
MAFALALGACHPEPAPVPPAEAWLTVPLLDPDRGRAADLHRLRAALAVPATAQSRFRQLRRLGIYLSHSATPDSGLVPLRAATRLGATLRPALPLELADASSRLAGLHWRHQRYDSACLAYTGAAQVLAAAFPTCEGRAAFRPSDGRNSSVGVSLAGYYANAGLAHQAQNQLPNALRCYDLARRAYQCAPDTAPQKLGGLAWVHTLFADALQEQGEPALAAAHYEQALAALRTQRRYDWGGALQEWATTLQGYAPHLLPARARHLQALATEEQAEMRRRLHTRPRDRDLLAPASTLALLEARARFEARDSATATALAAAAALLLRLRTAAGPEFRAELGYYALASQLAQLQAGWARTHARPGPAARYAAHARAYHDSVPEPTRRTRLGQLLAREWVSQHDYAAARGLLRPMARQQAQAHELQAQRQTLRLLARAYAGQGRYDSAFWAQQRADALADSLRGRQQRAAVAEAETRYRTSLKEIRIRELLAAEVQERHQKKLAWAGAALLALLLAVAAYALLLTRRLAHRLRAARATQNRLYAVIGHDLRGPLTAIEGLATLLDYYRQPALADPAALDELATEVRHTARQLTGLLDNLLHWAANQSGDLAYRPEALVAAELLQESAALYAPAARAQQVAVEVAVSPGLPPLWADRNMVLTQLRNLLGNALRVAPPGSTITLSAAYTAPSLVLSVADTGPGLSAAQLAALASGGSATGLAPRLAGQQGTGLGLPLVRQLAQRQGGAFWLESTLGQGTVARLVLPMAGE